MPGWQSMQTFCCEAKMFFISWVLPFREDTNYNSFLTVHSFILSALTLRKSHWNRSSISSCDIFVEEVRGSVEFKMNLNCYLWIEVSNKLELQNFCGTWIFSSKWIPKCSIPIHMKEDQSDNLCVSRLDLWFWYSVFCMCSGMVWVLRKQSEFCSEMVFTFPHIWRSKYSISEHVIKSPTSPTFRFWHRSPRSLTTKRSFNSCWCGWTPGG